MYTFSNLIKNIRQKAEMTQEEFAKVLGVSTILIAMIETDQKMVSRNFITRLANKLDVHPTSVTPFMFIEKDFDITKMSKPEKALIKLGERLQDHLVNLKAKKLREYV